MPRLSVGVGAVEYYGLDLETRKRLGIYYTPTAVAEVLVEWALPEPGHVIDPSFGGCSFLVAALDRLEVLGAANAGKLVHGVDIDEVGARFSAASLLARGVPADNVHFGDFFAVRAPTTDATRFTAVVGNPPYIRASSVDGSVSATAQAALEAAGIELPRTASLWAPFTVHSVQHVRTGGRLAFLLPSSLLHAAYSRVLLGWICTKFGRVRLIEIEDAVFANVQEETIVLACEDAGGHTANVEYDHIKQVSTLRTTLGSRGSARHPPSMTGWREELAPPDSLAVLAGLVRLPEQLSLGACCNVRIGVVTGANPFFVRSYSRGIAQSLCPVVARSGWLKGPIWANDDVAHRRRDKSRSWLLSLPADAQLPTELEEAVASGVARALHERSHCRRRDVWWSLADTRAPDVFLPYMNAGSPALTKNATLRTTCTNAIHRLYWKNRSRDETAVGRRDALLASSWTSAFALAAELVGRHYGGGVLKLEPSEACQLPLFTGSSPGLLEELDVVARRDGRRAARTLADQLVLRDGLGLSRGEVKALEKGIAVLQAHRGHAEA